MMKQLTTWRRRIQCISSRSVKLIIIWDVLMFTHLSLLQYFAEINYIHSHTQHQFRYDFVFDIAYCLLYLSFPLFGLLADVKTGRYNTIITGLHFLFLSWIFAGMAVIVKAFSNSTLFVLILLFGINITQVIGYCSVRSNIVQFSIDQSVGASADELSAIIYWHSASIPIAFVIVRIGQILMKRFAIVYYVLSGVAVSTVIISNSLFKHWLDTTPHKINPVKLIAKVLNYSRKNKYPRNRSALTYWEEDYPSRLDLGMEKYGGPFSEEEVQDVKTILRLIPLLISLVGFSCGVELSWKAFNAHKDDDSFLSNFVLSRAMSSLVSGVVIIIYQFVIYPCFVSYIPSMLKRIGLGTLLVLFTTVYYVIIFACKDHFHLDTTSYKAMLMPEILYGISYALVFPTSLEFIIAQSPHEMRGLMVGLWYAAYGLGHVIDVIGRYPFKCKDDIICQNLYYYVLKSAVVVITLILFVILAKQYKLRVRANEINVHLIAEEHYERYMDQEEEFRREMGLSFESTD